jgi:integrase
MRDTLRALVKELVCEVLKESSFEFIIHPQFGGSILTVNHSSPYLSRNVRKGEKVPVPLVAKPPAAAAPPVSRPVAPRSEAAIVPPASSKLDTGMLFKDAGPIWVRTRKPFCSAATYRRKQHHLNQLNVFFGEMTLAECTSADLVREYQSYRRDRAGADCINHEIQVFSEVLARVGLWKQVKEDYHPLRVTPSSAGRALSPDEERSFVQAANSNDEWQVAYWVAVLAAHTLLSPSEIFFRQLKDLDLRRETISVPKGKTDYRPREVPLNKHALKAARLLWNRAKQLGAWRPEHFLLPYRVKVGQYDPNKHAQGCRTAWRNLTRSIGLRGLRLKDMRHHGITILDENKTSSRITKALAGHSPNSRLLDRYSHPRLKAKKEAVRVLERRVKIA